MMKKSVFYIMALMAAMLFSCKDEFTIDDIEGVSDTITVSVVYSGTSATVSGGDACTVVIDGADVSITIPETSNIYKFYLSGTSTDGMFKTYGSHKFYMVLNNLTLNNNDGPAINNQCHKGLHVECPSGTVNTLTDGTSYTTSTEDQKGAFFSEGQIYFSGSGTLNVTGNYANAIASDDYITIESAIVINAVSSTGHGMKANDGMFIYDGTLNIDVTGDGAKGIKCDSIMTITGGTTTITTSGSSYIEEVDGVQDTTSCAGIKCADVLTMTDGTLTITSTGEGGKGINCDLDMNFEGGTLVVKTYGDKVYAAPKGVKSDTYITISGGYFYSYSADSRATDCANDDRYPTISGSPTTTSLTKHEVIVSFE